MRWKDSARPVVATCATAGVPMTLTLDGTRIGGPERGDGEWRSDVVARDFASAPVGFGPDTTTFIDPIRIAVPVTGN